MMLQATGIFGKIKAPPGINPDILQLSIFLSNVVRMLFVVAGLWTFLNFILAGYGFLNAGSDPKAISNSWAKIYQSLIGLVIIAASLLLTSVMSMVIFGDPGAILNLVVYGPA